MPSGSSSAAGSPAWGVRSVRTALRNSASNVTDEFPSDVTSVVNLAGQGDARAAQQLMPLVYTQLHRLARSFLARESPDHTLQATALVNEAYLKLVDQNRVDWKGRTHFFAVGAQAMRRILVDHARRKHRQKRGGDARRVPVEPDFILSPREPEHVLALDEALDRLAVRDQRQSRIVELRFFGGMTVQEVADALGMSKRAVEQEWTMIKAWLRHMLSGEDNA